MGRAGWNLLIARISQDRTDGLDCSAILTQIETGIKSAPKRKQDAMNQCLVEIATHFPELTQQGIEIGERVGKLDDMPVAKGCYTSYAPEWIALVLERKK